MTTPVAVIQGSIDARPVAKARRLARKPAPVGIGTPKKLRSCATMMSSAAPAVKPTITVCEMKLTSVPRRARPSTSWIAPTSRHSVRTSRMYSSLPGSASGATAANTTSDSALVGPETRCQDEPNSAATMTGTIAQ